MADFKRLLESITRQPAMYVGSDSLFAVSHFLSGYDLALEDLGRESPLVGWKDWVELRFGICSPAWHWTRILIHVYGSDAAAIEALPKLFTEFEADCKQIGVEGIGQNHDREFAAQSRGHPLPSTAVNGNPRSFLGLWNGLHRPSREYN
jgi:hypothetical protein